MAERVLVVAAHPDDEILGCGGTIRRHVDDGDQVAMLIVAEGATSRDNTRDVDARGPELKRLREAAQSAAAAVGVADLTMAGQPDNRLDSLVLLDVIKIVESAVARTAPTIVYLHHPRDLNVDHRVLHQATCTACRPLPGSPVREIYAFETPSSTEYGTFGTGPSFEPTHFVDIEGQWPAKRKALECYDMEMRPFPHARSIEAVEALAKWRGASTGLWMAEAFQVVRTVRPRR